MSDQAALAATPAADGSINTTKDVSRETTATAVDKANAAWFPQEQADYVANKAWKSPVDVLNSYVNLEKMVGADKAGRTVVIPKDDTDVEGMKAFREKIGVPADVKGYKIPEALNGDPIIGPAVEAAHKYGLPAKAFESFLGDVLQIAEKNNLKVAEDAKLASTQEMDAYKRELGPDRFDEQVNIAQRAFRHYAEKAGWSPEDLNAYEKGFGSKKIMSLFAAMGDTLKEDTFRDGNSSSFTMSASQAQAALDEARAKRSQNLISAQEWQSEFERLTRVIRGVK